MKSKRATLIILASGNSTRMGYPKGLIEIDHKPLLQHHIDAFSGQVLITRQKGMYEKFGLQNNVLLLTNSHPERGQFFSLQLALKKVQTPWVFILPVDTAPLTHHLFQDLLKHVSHFKALFPTYHEKKGHPVLLQTEWAKSLVTISHELDEARLDRQLNKLLQEEISTLKTPEKSCITNLNSKKDLEIFIRDKELL